jgi:uncharacterized protein (DUF362 family)
MQRSWDSNTSSDPALSSAEMSRRRFLRAAGVLAALSSAPLTSGCARLLDWSEGQQGSQQREMAAAPTSTPTTGASPDSTTGMTDSPSYPDLSVFRGPDPGSNVEAALTALGGLARFVAPGDRVVLKPNVLTGRLPEYATTTNPELLTALARACWEAGAREVVVLDRPTSAARTAFEVSGLAQAAAQADATVKYLSDRNFETVTIPEGRFLTSWPLVTDVFEADVFINMPIAKDHGMSRLTMAMKNLMGIMGGARGLVHVDFTQKIVDLNTLVRPHLVVLDATRVLVRNGPTGGSLDDVRRLDTIIVGTDQVAVDSYGATLFGLSPRDLSYVAAAEDRGLGSTDLAAMRVIEGVAGEPA